MKYRVLTVLVLLLAMLAGIQNANGRTQDTGTANETHNSNVAALPQPGYVAPNFTLLDMEGRQVQLSNLKGKKVFLNFWASWCPPCNDEMPDLVELSKKYRGQVEFYGMNLTASDKEEAAREFITKYKVEFPTLLDRSGDVARLYQAFAIPTTLTINSDGLVIDRRNGQLSPIAMEGLLKNLVEMK